MQQWVNELDTLRHLVKALRMRKVLHWHVTLHQLKRRTHLETQPSHSMSLRTIFVTLTGSYEHTDYANTCYLSHYT